MFLFGYLELGIIIGVFFLIVIIYSIINYLIDSSKKKKIEFENKRVLEEFNNNYPINDIDAYILEYIDEYNNRIKIRREKSKELYLNPDIRFKLTKSELDLDDKEDIYVKLRNEYLSSEAYKSFTFEKSLSFYELLSSYLADKRIKEPDLYNAAGISRQTFYKIKYEEGYIPRRNTIFKFILILKLNIEQANELLSRAGYQFNPSAKHEAYIKYCIEKEFYDLNEINDYLYDNFNFIL